jgi:peroxiredoxin
MIRAFGLVSVALVALVIAGCQEAVSKTSDAAAPPKIDSKVTPATATSDSKEEKKLGIGDKGPAWEKLTGTDDKEHSLKDLKKSKAVAVVFTCNTCPVAQAYEDRLMKLAADYKDKGVAIVAINVNNDDHNSLEAMKQRAEKKGFTYAYLIDPSQKIGREYGAVCTPHVFLLDKDRKVAYIGAIDDKMQAESVKEHYLQDAIDAVLAGKEVKTAKTKPVGCGIRYE